MKKSTLRYFIPLGVFLTLILVFGQGLSLDPRRLPSALVNKPAPEFQLPSLYSQQPFVSPQIFKGKVSLLNVWATWCRACRAEHPALMEIVRDYDVNIYGLVYKDNKDAADAWLARAGNPYKAVGVDVQGDVGIDLGVYGVPETYVIDQRGVIRYKLVGPITKERFENTLLPIIEKLDR